ncbi:sulfatase-like hydrolase/transferase [uncultured Phascolarctobacterium sp.]|uniref:phosphoethanolamine transferase n=1 Tax=uncultured Phascolarctobacterium sp. TaxID=512296 RepID=UPI0027D9C5D6|nr:sulfatase-like hydrolase/transferase [uncultured Phascolarctobacterium sp.]
MKNNYAKIGKILFFFVLVISFLSIISIQLSNTIFYDNRILLNTFGFFDLLLIVLFVILMNDEKIRLSDAIFLFCLTLIGIITPFLANKTGVFTFESKLIIREICFAIMIGECIILAKRLNNDKLKFSLNLFLYFILCSYFIGVIVNIGYFLKFKSIISGNTLVSIASTNINEVLEFSKSYFDISSLALFVVLFAVVYVGGKYVFSESAVCTGKPLYYFIILVLLIGIADYGHRLYIVKAFNDYKYIAKKQDQFRKMALNKKESFDTIVNNGGYNGLYVLIIGESLTRDNMSSYGYYVNTTPWAKSTNKDGNLILLKNPFSCWASTIGALNYALTEKSQYNDVDVSKATTIVEAAKKSGYKVSWISNQQKYDFPTGIIADVADRKYWVNQYLGKKIKSSNYDEKIIDALKKEILINEEKKLIVIHLMGSHQDYNDRFPKEYSKFSHQKTSEVQIQLDSYNNSVLYNDYIISQIYEVLFSNKNIPKAMLYFADHGEEVTYMFGHTVDKFEPSMYRIPVYIALSAQYKKEHGQIVENIEFNKTKYFTNDMVYDTMLGLMGVFNSGYNDKQDITSDKYNGDKKTLKVSHGKIELEKCL